MPDEGYLAQALAAADWFVNTQVRMEMPYWDANHGRLVYNYHIPTQATVLGLSWTQGRGIITLLGAWEATRESRYLRTAIQAAEYIKHLQILDERSPRRFGAIREECPASWYVYPRDALEAGIGLMHLWRATGVEEYLYRARLFADWFLRVAMEPDGWTPAGVMLYEGDDHENARRRSYCLGGGAYFFVQLARATGDERYLDDGFRPLARYLLEHYVRPDGVVSTRDVTTPTRARGSADRYGDVALNDDCCGITMLVAYDVLGEEVYLDRMRRYGDWMLEEEGPLPRYAAVPLQALTLLDLSAVSGDEQYAEFARGKLGPEFVARQVVGSADPAVDGAFRGEDEPARHYAPEGAHAEEFVNTRCTAYAANALFKLDGTIFGPYYSAVNWDVSRVPLPSPELLAPYRGGR
ncbi:MAG: hypothetical protein R6V58_06640 [Planctomycetota bacterium]